MTDGLLRVPERFRAGLERFAREHVSPGGALRSVLENDLQGALSRLDDDLTRADIRALCLFVYNEMQPGNSWGSWFAVRAWIAKDRATCEHCLTPGPWYETLPDAIDMDPPMERADVDV